MRQRVEHRPGQALRVLGAFAPHRRDGCACGSSRTRSRSVRRQRGAARVRAAPRPQSASDRLPARHLVARAKARRLRALRVPRGDVSVARLPARLRRDPGAAAWRPQGRPRVPAHPCTWRPARIEADVEAVLAEFLASSKPITADAVKALVASSLPPAVPEMVAPEPSTWAPTTRCWVRWGHDDDDRCPRPTPIARDAAARPEAADVRAPRRGGRDRRPSAKGGPSRSTFATSPSSKSTSAADAGSSAT